MRIDGQARIEEIDLWLSGEMSIIETYIETQYMRDNPEQYKHLISVTILDRETVELIEDALDGCITMGVPEKDAKIQAALKALRAAK